MKNAFLSAILTGVLLSIPAYMPTESGPAWAQKQKYMKIGNFSATDPSAGLPAKWEPMTFEDIDAHTEYRLVREDGRTVVRAKSRNAASGLIRKVRVDPEKYPVIEWQWKATGIYEGGDVTKKSGDDYPARIYIAFEYDPDTVGFFERAKFAAIKALHGEYPPSGAINYIWESKKPVGTMVPNPYTERVMMFVVESGTKNLNTWVSESRNIAADYRAAFGKSPPAITGIAIMTDTDNTAESTVTYYGDIVLKTAR